MTRSGWRTIRSSRTASEARERVSARVLPEQKLRIVQAMKFNG